ncbi:hypothetical protein V2J09_017678 [Rumex salicifolius]
MDTQKKERRKEEEREGGSEKSFWATATLECWPQNNLPIPGIRFFNTIRIEQQWLQNVLEEGLPAGFTRIDCGLSKGSNYRYDVTSLYYISDDGLIETDINMDIAPNFLCGYDKPLRNVRSFPKGTKNCYTIRPKQGKSTNY